MAKKELDKKKIASLIDLLRGDLTIQEFSEKANVAAISVSKIKAGAYVPSERTIRSLCDASLHPDRDSLFYEFMSLAGHATLVGEGAQGKVYWRDEEQESFEQCPVDHDDIEGTKLEYWIKRKYERRIFSIVGRKEVKERIDEGVQAWIRDEFMALSALRSRLEDKGNRVEQYFNAENIHDIASTGRMKIDGGKEYWFHIIPSSQVPWEDYSLRAADMLFAKMVRLQPKKDRKVSLVVFEQSTFDKILRYAPIGLRMNLSIIYVDLKSFPIEMYENVLTLHNEDDEDIMLRLAEEREAES